MTHTHRPLLAALAALALLSPARAEPSVGVDVRSHLPVSCRVSVVASQVVTITPLLINATVAEACNTKHDLSVTYNTLLVIHPNRLTITYDGRPPNVPTPGNQTWTNLAATNTQKPLVIRYSGGTRSQRELLAQTWGITVTPR